MRTLRSKIFIFVAVLLVLPAIPLSFLITDLLDRSYQIGVNKRVEAALDGGLRISSDFYQSQKNRLSALIKKLTQQSQISGAYISDVFAPEFSGLKHNILSLELTEPRSQFIDQDALTKFLSSDQSYVVWPAPDRLSLLALARIQTTQVIELVYEFPESFKNSAMKIQEVSQMYKTLGLVKTEIRNSFLYTFLMIYGLGIGLALLVSYFISHKITQPISSLIQATSEVAAGNLEYKIKFTENNEFRTLADAFNHMTDEISANQQKIIELEKMAMWQTMARRLAHEIKNPLTPIQLMAQQLVDKYSGSDREYQAILAESYEIIEQEVESLKKLVRAFSDFARLPDFQPADHNITDLLQTIQKLYSDQTVKTEVPQQKIELRCDYDHLKRVLINLIDNALAAQEKNVPIVLTLEEEETAIVITVSDQGSGIKPQHLQQIFEPYFSTKKSGVGLGLAIVKKIIEEHNGQIFVESELGQGTRFSIRLPIINPVDTTG